MLNSFKYSGNKANYCSDITLYFVIIFFSYCYCYHIIAIITIILILGSIFNTLSSKQEGSFSPTTEDSSFIHYQTSVSRSSMAIYATTKKKKPVLSPGNVALP